MSGTYKYQRGLKEHGNKKDTYSQDLNKTADMSWSHNEKGLENLTLTRLTEGKRHQRR